MAELYGHSKCGRQRECFDMNTQKLTYCHIAVLVSLLLGSVANAQRVREQDENQQPTRQAQAVSKTVFEKIQASQEASDNKDYVEALRILNALIDRGRLTDYEKSNVYRYIGFTHHSAGDVDAAILTFDKVLEIPALEVQIRQNTLYTLAQLNVSAEQYEAALSQLGAWLEDEPEPAPAPLILYAQILYQLAQYGEMISPIEKALAIADERGFTVKEQWYSLLVFAYFQREDYAKIRDISTILVANWSKKQYWMYLANAYRELGNEEKFIATYEASYLQGLLENESELITLAQLYLQHEVPIKAATLLEAEMKSGRVTANAKNLRLLSQAWSLAQEDEQSIDPLRSAAELESDGELYVRLANIYLNLGQHKNCIESINAAEQKGNIKNPDYAQISFGMCLYNIREYQSALRAFRSAGQSPRSARTANQWINVVRADIQREEQIALFADSLELVHRFDDR
jgi:hypothetical protein